MIAVDLDGTLLDSRKRVCAESAAALRVAMERGVEVVIASARPPRSVRGIWRELGLRTWQVNYNGALVWDETGGRVVEHFPLASEVWRAVVAAGRGRFPRVQVACEIVDRWYTDRFDPTHVTETGKTMGPDVIGPLGEWGHLEVTKLMFLGPAEEMGELHELVLARFASEVAAVRTDADLVQVMLRGVNKARGVERIAREMGIGRAEVLAIGDAPNDIELLSEAGLGVAVANAPEAVREVADFVAANNDSAGVAAALRWAGVA
jgi:5-amino-6-(5-phospho-D-ribitylamino)uracil phosphatase